MGVKTRCANFECAATMVDSVDWTDETSVMVDWATPIVSRRVRLADCLAVEVPLSMEARREVDLMIIGKVPRGSLAPFQLATVVFRSSVLAWMSAIEAIIAALSARTEVARARGRRMVLNCMLIASESFYNI